MRLFTDEAVAGFLAEGWWTGETWGDHFRRAVERYGDRVALVDAFNKQDFMGQSARRLTWRELESAVDRCAEAFYAGGINEGEVVGVQIPNSVELVVTYLALNRLGAIVSPYPMAYRQHEVRQLAGIAGVSAIVTTASYSGRVLPADLGEVVESVEGARTLFVWHGDPDGPHSVLPEALLSEVSGAPSADRAYRAHVDALRPHPNDCVIIIFTSGTTGIPKGVPRAHGDSMVSATTTAALPRLTADDVLLNSMPMVNAGSIAGIFLPWLLVGCRLVQHQPFDLDIFATQIETERVTYTVVPPTILNDMVADDKTFSRYDLSSLRVVGAGSAPLSGITIERWESEHGIEVINFFGATEGLQLTSDRDTVPDPSLRGRCIPVPGSPRFNWRTEMGRRMKVRLVDVETGLDITEPGHPGELHVQAPNLFSGYLHRVEDPFDEQGYYRTGDIFEFSTEEPDMLVHVDRKKDLIIRGGLNISAVEIESLLIGHPKVAEVAAIGKKDPRLGERTCVFVVARDGSDPPSLAELITYLDDLKVAKFKLPEFLELVDTLPRNPSGKILKRDLRVVLNGSQTVI